LINGRKKERGEKEKSFSLKHLPCLSIKTLFSNIIKFCQKKSNQKSRK
jgi:hypothetical protein